MQNMKNSYRTIFISDVHLGSKDCKAKELDNFLKKNSCNTLYLVGDIIDGWKIASFAIAVCWKR
jgi:UDP-2,3-diacylglucosamine pyrophosphatase LpxH